MKVRRRGACIARVANEADRLSFTHERTDVEPLTNAIEVSVIGAHPASTKGVHDGATQTKRADVRDDAVMRGKHGGAPRSEDVDALVRAPAAARRPKGARQGCPANALHWHAQRTPIEDIAGERERPEQSDAE